MSTATRHLTALMFVLMLSCAPAWAEHRLVFFGDSLSDPGNYYLAFGQVSQAPFAPIPMRPTTSARATTTATAAPGRSSSRSSWTRP